MKKYVLPVLLLLFVLFAMLSCKNEPQTTQPKSSVSTVVTTSPLSISPSVVTTAPITPAPYISPEPIIGNATIYKVTRVDSTYSGGIDDGFDNRLGTKFSCKSSSVTIDVKFDGLYTASYAEISLFSAHKHVHFVKLEASADNETFTELYSQTLPLLTCNNEATGASDYYPLYFGKDVSLVTLRLTVELPDNRDTDLAISEFKLPYTKFTLSEYTEHTHDYTLSTVSYDTITDNIKGLRVYTCDICSQKISLPEYNSYPTLVKTNYETKNQIVADSVIYADPNGKKDATNAINTALRKCYENGGGTVYLPAGKYKVSNTVTIPAYCSLVGDWADPDTLSSNDEYNGTIILAYKSASSSLTDGLFSIYGSAGVSGLTVYYPEQNISSPKSYSPTFYVIGDTDQEGYMLSTVERCTVINGYVGISTPETPAHEQLSINDFHGTFLKYGIVNRNSADVDMSSGISLSSKYWLNAPRTYALSADKKDALISYMRDNTTGMYLTDLEWAQFVNTHISDCNVGIYIDEGKRYYFSGMFWQPVIKDCNTGIYIQKIDDRWGFLVSGGEISGSECCINNQSDGLYKDTTQLQSGVVKLCGVKINGEYIKSVSESNGKLVHLPMQKAFIFYDEELSQYEDVYKNTVTYKKPQQTLYVADLDKTGKKDVSASLSSILEEAGKTKGIVYLPAGRYLLNSPITVPEGVELRGCSFVATRDQTSQSSKGTVIYTNFGVFDSVDQNEYQPLVTLSDNSGISGIRFIYIKNGPYADTAHKTSYTVKARAKNVYITNCSIAASGYGVDFRGCENYLIEKLVSLCYYNAITAGGKNGLITGCLQNGTVALRLYKDSSFNGFNNTNALPDNYIFTKITGISSDYIILKDAENVNLLNNFAYGTHTVLTLDNSHSITSVNIGGDALRYASESDDVKAPMFNNLGTSQAVIINSLRYSVNGNWDYNGQYSDDEGHIGYMTIINRMAINHKDLTNVHDDRRIK